MNIGFDEKLLNNEVRTSPIKSKRNKEIKARGGEVFSKEAAQFKTAVFCPGGKSAG